MKFTWICYKSGEDPDINDPSSLPMVYPNGSTPTFDGNSAGNPVPISTGGCFTKGPGRMPFNDASVTITFDNSLMVRGKVYYMVLRVEKRQRFGIYKQKLAVAEAPPPFNIRYEIPSDCTTGELPYVFAFRYLLTFKTNYRNPAKEFLFYGRGTRHKKVLAKSIPRVRDLEDIILRPRVIATYAFLAITFIFFFSFTAQKGVLKE